jgi:hypothetical protein
MLGDEHEDERDTGFRQVLDIIVTPVSSMCISNGAQKKTVRPEWDAKVFAYATSRYGFLFDLFALVRLKERFYHFIHRVY